MYVIRDLKTQTGISEITTIGSRLNADNSASGYSSVARAKKGVATALAMGTFGIIALTGVTTINPSTRQTMSPRSGSIREISPTSNVAARDIAHVRDSVGISISELASTLNVSRQAVHEWIKGGAISEKNSQRLSQFVQAVDVFGSSEVTITPYALRRRLKGGPSVLQTIAEGGDGRAIAELLVKTLAIELSEQNRISSRSGTQPSIAGSGSASGDVSKIVKA